MTLCKSTQKHIFKVTIYELKGFFYSSVMKIVPVVSIGVCIPNHTFPWLWQLIFALQKPTTTRNAYNLVLYNSASVNNCKTLFLKTKL